MTLGNSILVSIKKAFLLIFKTTWPFALITLVTSLMANTDIYMLGIWRNATEIGLYSSVQRIQSFIIILPSILATASFPLISRLAENDKKKFGTILGKTIVISLSLGIPIALGGTLLAKDIVPLVFGPTYTGRDTDIPSVNDHAPRFFPLRTSF